MSVIPRLSGAIDRFLNLGASPEDTDEERAYKSTHILMSGVTAPVVSLWSVFYAAFGLTLAAAIPLVYAGMTAAGLVLVARTKRIELFRRSQLTMWVTLPFLLQWSVGGFINSSGVAMWAIGAPLLASLIGAVPGPWFLGFAGLSVVSGVIDGRLAAIAPDLPSGLIVTLFVLNFLGVAFVIYVSLRFFVRERQRMTTALELERRKSDLLLLNILPERIAQRLKSGEELIADRVDDVTILFADLVGSTAMSERLAADELVELLNELFTAFDELADSYGLEKIKVIGDAYMVVGGLEPQGQDHTARVADMALAMRRELPRHGRGGHELQMRFGIHAGPVIAGVIGRRKFSYDLYGDAVNTAARMESHGIAGQIQVSEEVYRRLASRYVLEERGTIDVKGKGPMKTYLLGEKVPTVSGELGVVEAGL
ncbi:MAG TPA: adenylate/guanylate cyclase domain-containing protein [Acidimicrobiia bacterium]